MRGTLIGSFSISSVSILAGILAFATLASSCRFGVARVRVGQPLKFDEFEDLKPGESDMAETLEALGAPEKTIWESGKTRLTWLYLDETFFQAEVQIPISLFGYRHNLFRYFQDRDRINQMELLFDDQQVLEQKDLRLPAVYKTASDGGSRWHITPRFEHSMVLLGQLNFESYDTLFHNGPVLALEVGYQPVAPITFSVAGSYAQFSGSSLVTTGGNLIDMGDLELYTVEALIRIQLPLRVFAGYENFRNIWDLFLESDPSSHDGWLLYVDAGIGGTVNGNVPVQIDGVQSSFWSNSLNLSNSTTMGIEYSANRVSLRAGVGLRIAGGFDAGDSPLDSSGNSLTALIGTVSLGIKF